jgi:hypothetical protein
MTPFSFEWQWNADYFIFMGLLYIALAVIGCGLVYCLAKTWLSLGEGPGSGAPKEISYRKKYPRY